MATEIGSPPRFFHMPRFQHQAPRQLFYKRPDYAQQQAMQQLTFDGKRMRKAVNRKTIDYNPSVIKYLENRVWQRDQRDMRAIQPDAGYYNDLVPPIGMLNNPLNAVTTKFVRTSTNKVKCPVFVVRWTPEGRRLVTGASSGEFTLWNGLTFNFETILQAHDSPVRAMTWSHNDMWMLTADHSGYVKYWQSNMNNVKMFQAHKEAIREASMKRRGALTPCTSHLLQLRSGICLFVRQWTLLLVCETVEDFQQTSPFKHVGKSSFYYAFVFNIHCVSKLYYIYCSLTKPQQRFIHVFILS